MFCCKTGTAEKDKQPPGKAASTSNNPVADGAGAVAEAAAEEADLGGAAEAVDDPEIGEDVVSLVEQLISMPNPTASQFTAAPVIGFFCSIIDGTTVKASLLAPVELAMRIFFNAAVEVSETPSFLFCIWFEFSESTSTFLSPCLID